MTRYRIVSPMSRPLIRRNMIRRTMSRRRSVRFDRALLVIQSDDWGRVGVRDREGSNELQAAGLRLGENPYDFYSVETSDDLHALSALLQKHRDSIGRHPCIGMNFVMANVDFPRSRENKTERPFVSLKPLTDGLPEPWRRPGLMEGYREGIRLGLLCPALHGLTHFCAAAVERALTTDVERRELLHKLWGAGTPYIYWRMPWVGYEYWDPALPPKERFLSLDAQRSAIDRAVEIYEDLFESSPVSACAPGYRANQDTRSALFAAGVRVLQGGPGNDGWPVFDNTFDDSADGSFADSIGDALDDSRDTLAGSVFDKYEMLCTFRNVEIEPATGECRLEEVVERTDDCLSRGLPAIVSIHSINFHSTIRDFRTPALRLLDDFLGAIERRWPDLLYVNDGDLWEIATQGAYVADSGKIRVRATLVEA